MARSQLRALWRLLPGLLLGMLLMAAPDVSGQTPTATESPLPPGAMSPLVVCVAIDEAGITPADLRTSQELVLALFDVLPKGSLMAIGSFSGDKRIMSPPTSDRSLLSITLARFKAGQAGVALPDGLFDMVEYLASRDAAAKSLLLVSTGRVRDGDLQFEDPLNAATSAGIPIFVLALGQGDGKLLRRIAKVTGGDYVRLEVADASMLANALAPRSESRPAVVVEREPQVPSIKAEPKGSGDLLGVAAVFFTLGGLLLLGIVVLLVRRLGDASNSVAQVAVAVAVDKADPAKGPGALRSKPQVAARPQPDDPRLERTLVINADPILRALSGPGAGKNFPLSPTGPTSLGRSRRNDIVVPEDAASAQHCRIDREGDSYVMHDLGATNGTWVNGAKTERAVLQHGDRLKVGDTLFTVSLFGDRS